MGGIPREVWIEEEEVNLSLYYEYEQACDLVASGNISLTGVGQSIDGQVVAAGNIIHAVGQSTPSQNGCYLVPGSGAWAALPTQQPQVVWAMFGSNYSNTKWNLDSANTYTQQTMAFYDPTPVRSETYCQNLSIKPKNQLSKFRQPGATAPSNNPIPDGVEITMDAFYERQLNQWTPYLDVTKKFRFDWSLVNPRYDGLVGDLNENDDHAFRNCTVAGQTITRKDNEVVVVALQMEAENQGT